MATGISIQIARQMGEHLVTAELGRRGFIATPFAGNVPHFDIIAADQSGHLLPIQVKAIRGQAWQFTATHFLDIELAGDTQFVRGKVALPDPRLICVFVLIAPNENTRDRYFVFELGDLQEHFFGAYGSERRRPRNPASYHCALWPKDVAQYEDNWKLIESRFEALRNSSSLGPRNA